MHFGEGYISDTAAPALFTAFNEFQESKETEYFSFTRDIKERYLTKLVSYRRKTDSRVRSLFGLGILKLRL
jgi:hypothetical protein